MRKILIIAFIMIQIAFLTSCQSDSSVYSKPEETTSTKNVDESDTQVYGFSIQPGTNPVEYYQLLGVPTELYQTSPFFHGGVISNSYVGDLEEIKIETNYYVNLDEINCFQMANIMYADEIFSTVNTQQFCEQETLQLYYQFNNNQSKTEFTVHLHDIDYLESFQVVQYDINHDKLFEQEITLDGTKLTNVVLLQDAVDFILIEKYMNTEDEVYYKRTLHTVEELSQTNNPFNYYTLYGLDDSGIRHRYQFHFEIEIVGDAS